MPNIHLPSSEYNAPSKLQDWQWLPYSNKAMLDVVKRAIMIIDKQIKGNRPCEAAFKTLTGGKSFTDIQNSSNVWISYDPDRSGNKFGVAFNKQHISITAYTLAMGQWMTAAPSRRNATKMYAKGASQPQYNWSNSKQQV